MHLFLICDSPARAFMTGVKGHNGYFGCQQEGEFIDNRMIFPELDNILRPDESFKNRLQPEPHKSKSYLENPDVGLVVFFTEKCSKLLFYKKRDRCSQLLCSEILDFCVIIKI